VYNAGGERVVKQYLPYATNQCLGCDENTGMVDLEVYERNSNTPNIYKASKTITFLSEYTDVRYRDYSAIIEAGLAQCTPQCAARPALNTSDADIYIRDATGNVLAVYHYDRKTSQLRWSEQHLYGSARLGMHLPEKLLTSVSTDSKQREVGYLGKQVFELSNHLGNILATITDKKLQVSLNTTSTAYFEADVQTVQDYYAFGMQMFERRSSKINYRYGLNGIELADEISGSGNHYTALFGEYDSRLGRRWNKDPKPNTSISEYAVFANNAIWYSDVLLDTLPMTYSSLKASYPTTGSPKQMYNIVGGDVAKAYNDGEAKDPTNNPYANTCALRMSVALNKSGNDLDIKINNNKGESMYTLTGGDKKEYALRKNDIKDYMKAKYGKADLITKSTDKDFDEQISKIQGQKGVIVFDVSGWGNATGHITIYDGNGNCGHDCYFKDAIEAENVQRREYNSRNPPSKKMPLVELKGVSLWIAK
jgi:hypothetical protein